MVRPRRGSWRRLNGSSERLRLQPKAIWLTHAHIDHAGGVAELARQAQAGHRGPARGRPFLDCRAAAAKCDVWLSPAGPFEPTRWLQDGDTVAHWAGDAERAPHARATRRAMWRFMPRKLSAASWAMCCLPAASAAPIFPQGNHQQLIDSIVQRPWPMGDQTVFIPGHGQRASFGRAAQDEPDCGQYLKLHAATEGAFHPPAPQARGAAVPGRCGAKKRKVLFNIDARQSIGSGISRVNP